jgi:hypothetical protein
MNCGITYGERVLHSIKEARVLLGGISPTTLYKLLHSGELASVVIGARRFISADAIAELVRKSTTTVSPAAEDIRSRKAGQNDLPLPLPPAIIKTRVRPREV